MPRSYAVGFIGAGGATQAIYLPVLATLPGRFHVRTVMSPTLDLAERVAMRCSAAATTSWQQVVEDDRIDVVAICSPHAAHSEQAIAACAAGRKLVMCEKPVAVSQAEAEAIAVASRRSGTRLIVGTQHAYDPAFAVARQAWREAGESAHFVRSSIHLPANDVFVDQAADLVRLKPPPANDVPQGPDAAFDVRMFQRMMLGLAIHNIPLLRAFYPAAGTLTSARFLRPAGYQARATDGRTVAELQAVMHGDWPPQWTMRVIGAAHELRIAFPPSYVLAGSARVELVGRGQTRVFEQALSGYQALWMHVCDVLEGAAPMIGLDDAIADLGFAIDLGRQAEPLILGGA